MYYLWIYWHQRDLPSNCKVRVDPFFRDLVQFTILLPLKDLSSVHNPYLLAMKNMITIRSRSFFFKAENWKYSWNIVIYAVICWKNNLKLQWSDLFPINSPPKCDRRSDHDHIWLPKCDLSSVHDRDLIVIWREKVQFHPSFVYVFVLSTNKSRFVYFWYIGIRQ